MAYYTAFEVMECSWAELIKHLKSAENLDEVIDAHEEFLNSVIRRALLGEGSRDLLTQIRAIYDRIVEFDAVQSRYNPNLFLYVIELAILEPNTNHSEATLWQNVIELILIIYGLSKIMIFKIYLFQTVQ